MFVRVIGDVIEFYLFDLYLFWLGNVVGIVYCLFWFFGFFWDYLWGVGWKFLVFKEGLWDYFWFGGLGGFLFWDYVSNGDCFVGEGIV